MSINGPTGKFGIPSKKTNLLWRRDKMKMVAYEQLNVCTYFRCKNAAISTSKWLKTIARHGLRLCFMVFPGPYPDILWYNVLLVTGSQKNTGGQRYVYADEDCDTEFSISLSLPRPCRDPRNNGAQLGIKVNSHISSSDLDALTSVHCLSRRRDRKSKMRLEVDSKTSASTVKKSII